jgi:hypothetical protein
MSDWFRIDKTNNHTQKYQIENLTYQ